MVMSIMPPQVEMYRRLSYLILPTVFGTTGTPVFGKLRAIDLIAHSSSGGEEKCNSYMYQTDLARTLMYDYERYETIADICKKRKGNYIQHQKNHNFAMLSSTAVITMLPSSPPSTRSKGKKKKKAGTKKKISYCNYKMQEVGKTKRLDARGWVERTAVAMRYMR
jgi:hypothetical protein